MVAVTDCGDFGAQENKICHCFHFFPFYFPWTDGPGCHDLSFFWVSSLLFHSPPPSSRGSSVPLPFLLIEWCHLHIWGCWYFSHRLSIIIPACDSSSLAFCMMYFTYRVSQVVLAVKNPPANAGDVGLTPGSRRSPGGGHGNPLQYSCLENPTDGGASQAAVHSVAKSWTQRKRLSTALRHFAFKLNKESNNIQPWRTPFPFWNQSVVPCLVLTASSWPKYRFLRRQVRRSGIPISLRIFHSLFWCTQSL